MARGRKNIKGKRNKSVRSARRARKTKHPDKIKKVFTNEVVKQNWDTKKTLRQNYEKLGLEVNPNEHKKLMESIKGYEKEDDSGMLYNVEEIRKTGGLPVETKKNRVENYVPEEEQKYLEPLIAKHDKDYTKMSRDLKLNKWQWTENKLRRRCERLEAYKQAQAQSSAEQEEEDEEMGEEEDSEE
eukprot:gb/GECG01012975.1/.p1 GENE.gb/GECG01012975.1/~~gb/GECG01012975.1/.p1  ORF type:complete len:185 (+),score=38.32 gb/GECG01012975.1/:1-555(+)